jgi:hypothetical protein
MKCATTPGVRARCTARSITGRGAFLIELVVPESPTAQHSPAKEQQQPKDQDIEDEGNEEYTPPSDAKDEKMCRDTDEVESFGVKALVLAGRLRALLEHLGITTAPRYRIKEVSRSGRVEFKAIAEIFFGSRVLCQHKGPVSGPLTTMLLLMPLGRPSHRGSTATSVGCRTLSTTSCPIGRRINSRLTG